MLSKRTSRRAAIAYPTEALESRQMLTGNVFVTTSGNNLRITGDGAANSIAVVQRNGNVVVEPTQGAGTNVRGGITGIAINQLNDVSIRMRGGDDNVRFESLTVNGNLSLNTAGGNDFTNFVGSSRVSGDTSIRTGGGRDFLYTESFDFRGRLNLATGGGDDFVLLGSQFSNLSFQDRVNVSMGGGSDSLALDSFTTVSFAGTGHRINGGGGFDNLFPLTSQFRTLYPNVSVRNFEM
ncbi:MAG: hypothetical protein AB8G99_23075 [Planctomycetaceae bacterium]